MITSIKAVAYLRRSTKNQEESLEVQKELIEQLAKEHGLTIAHWYIDDGISGGKSKRPEFQQMIGDAKERKFDILLARSRSRLTRLGPRRSVVFFSAMVDSGVRMITVDDGEIDIDNFAGFIKEAAGAYAEQKYLEDLAKLTIGGQVSRVKQGRSAGQSAPYGFDRMYCDKLTGEHKKRMRRGEGFIKNKDWFTKFVPSADEQEVETVVWIFETYAYTRKGFRGIADDLNARGVLSPNGGTWSQGTIRAILKNEKYQGDYVWNKKREGAYSKVVDGRAVDRPKTEFNEDEPKVILNETENWTVNMDNHEPLVSRELFEISQDKMSRRKAHDGVTEPRANAHLYLLRSKVYCVHCGSKMHGTKMTRRKNGKVYEYRKYICSKNSTHGASQCDHNTVNADELHESVIREIVKVIQKTASRDRLKAAFERLATKSNNNDDSKKTKAAIKKIDAHIERLLDLPDDLQDVAVKKLRELKRQRASLQEQSDKKPVETPQISVDAAMARLDDLAVTFQHADQEKLHGLLQAMVSRVELRFRTEQQGKRRVRVFEHGEIFLAQPSLQVERVAGTGFEPATSRL